MWVFFITSYNVGDELMAEKLPAGHHFIVNFWSPDDLMSLK